MRESKTPLSGGALGSATGVSRQVIVQDIALIRAAGYDVITPVLICNTPDFPDMVCHTGMEVKAQDPVIEL